MSDFISVYMTAPSRDEAWKIAASLVDEKLAACVNVFPDIHSVYVWQGKTEKTEEVAFLAKTAAVQFKALKKRVLELHSSDCPCIVAWPIVDGHEAYLSWIGESLKA